MKSTSIHVLPPKIAERIAAGEVIERPASVIKELVENSLDAGASRIEVRIENGGRDLIEVTDNGQGMSPADLVLCIQRHATSKIETLQDLETLASLGFRGEALPSIAAVSDLQILSRTAAERDAYRLQVEDVQASSVSAYTHGQFLGSPHGTRIQSLGLFARVPARLKFLKSQSAETSAVREIIERLSLTHPKVAFRLVADDRELLKLESSNEPTRVAAVLAGEEGFPIISETRAYGGIEVRAHWLKGSSFPQTRKLAQVINQRAIKDRLVQQAMLHAFKQHLLPGQFPAAAVFLSIDPSLIDVNVHPTKSEVRFIESRKVFHAIESAFENLIASHGAAPHLGSTQSPSFTFSTSALSSSSHSSPAFPVSSASTSTVRTTQSELQFIHSGRYLGQIFSTYLLFEKEGLLQVLDQHAAHERIRYEELHQIAFGQGPASSQPLLLPETITIDPEKIPQIKKKLPQLEKLGFEAEVFSASSLLFRGLPPAWGTHQIKIRLKNFVEKILETDSDDAFDERLFEALASEACHSSVRAGEVLNELEAKSLATRLLTCQNPWNCPHGRPTLIEVPEIRFEEWFQRRV